MSESFSNETTLSSRSACEANCLLTVGSFHLYECVEGNIARRLFFVQYVCYRRIP
ncbi:Uncharacterised protein [Bordetella pertussis]|nr:Uncharacterised protein [Bordetella pertussis]CFP61794.1 Uncharacterised protein [Bordetella pertussis]